MPDYMSSDMAHDIKLRLAEGEVEEELSKPTTGSKVDVQSDDLVTLCGKALAGVREYRRQQKAKEIAWARGEFVRKNTPGWFGRLLGLKPKPDPGDEWLYKVTCRGGGVGSLYGGEATFRVAERLIVAAAHAEKVSVSVEDIERLDRMASWAPGPGSRDTYR